MSDIPDPSGNTWGMFLRLARLEKGLTQEELADHADVSRQSIIRWERGASIPKYETFSRVAMVLGFAAADAWAKLQGDDDAPPLPAPLPPEIARIVRAYELMSPVDRMALLNNVEMIADWAEAMMAMRNQRVHSAPPPPTSDNGRDARLASRPGRKLALPKKARDRPSS